MDARSFRGSSLGRTEFLPSPPNFNRTVYGAHPGLSFNASLAGWVSERPPGAGQNASDWKLDVPPAPGNVSTTLMFQFNGTGIDLAVSSDALYMDPEPGQLQVQLRTPGTPPEMAAVDVSYSPANMMWTAKSDPTKLVQNQWLGSVTFPAGVRCRVERLSFLYNIPLEQ